MKPHEWRWAIRDSGLDKAAKAVGHALASRMNGAGTCWPSKQQLADDTGYSTRWVDEAVNRLGPGTSRLNGAMAAGIRTATR